MRTKPAKQKMSSPPSNSETASFGLLDERIQRWIWSQGWTSLRAVQEYAIPPLLSGTTDVILAAATSAGKTEAAFFPLLTRLLKSDVASRCILSISPLKALINDQTQRLTLLCELLDLPVLGWHGDVSASRKQKFIKEMSGILIITPESLEAFFVNKGTTIPALAKAIQCVVIDELHSFIGTERGKQVQSLLHRLEIAANRRMPRIGLSATLGDKSLAAEYLRPGAGNNVQTIEAEADGSELKLIVKGYCDEWAVPQRPPDADETEISEEFIDKTEDELSGSAMLAIADDLYHHLRGSNNLVFPNSRSKVEYFADQLRRRCERENVPNVFWPHHGSLSRELREESEAALKNGETAASAICTTTLELGIDIGNIRSVAQVGPPPSVASLRQRLGRSGRRAGESAILRCFVVERKLTLKSNFSDKIREGLVQTVAMVRLLIARWVEPPRPEALHASTLVQQILSVIAQKGGATAAELWATLVRSGIFGQVGSSNFSDLLQALGAHDLITQDYGGSLLPGVLGEKLINQFDFYSAFSTGEEFRLIAESRVLGSLPIERPLTSGQRIIFGGHRWKVQDIDTHGKAVYVVRDRGGAPPSFNGIGGIVHDRVRQEMKQVLTEVEPLSFLDSKAAEFLQEARQWFRTACLRTKRWSVDGDSILLLGWHGDTVQDALALLLTARGMQASNEGVAIRISSTDQQRLLRSLQEIGNGSAPTIFDLRIKPEHTIREKWDWVLPEGLRLGSFASAQLDLLGAQRLALTLSQGLWCKLDELT
jgi:ATP-dependent helicase Lhr and Lhr-like helicase